jgi:outer membrane protein
MAYRRTTIALLAALLTSPLVSAETLSDAWNAALRSHSLIAAAKERSEAAGRELEGTRAERRPRVDLTTGYTRLDQAPRFAFDGFVSPPLFDGDSFVVASAQVSVPIYTGGSLGHGITAAESAADASARAVTAVTQGIKLAVAAAYVDVLRAESALAVADSNVATLTAHTDDTSNRFESGVVPRNDYLAASVALADARQRRLTAANALELARSAYNRLLGRDMSAAVELRPDLGIDALVPSQTSLEALLAMAREQRPELAALESSAVALRERSSAARASRSPQLALTGGYQRLENQILDEEAFWMVGLAFQWNLFDSGRSASRAAALDRQANALMDERAELDGQIALEIRRALLDRTEAMNRRLVAGQAVEQAVENLDVARDRYLSGAGTNADVLSAETLRTQSVSNLDNAGFDFDMARLELARAVGSL